MIQPTAISAFCRTCKTWTSGYVTAIEKSMVLGRKHKIMVKLETLICTFLNESQRSVKNMRTLMPLFIHSTKTCSIENTKKDKLSMNLSLNYVQNVCQVFSSLKCFKNDFNYM